VEKTKSPPPFVSPPQLPASQPLAQPLTTHNWLLTTASAARPSLPLASLLAPSVFICGKIFIFEGKAILFKEQVADFFEVSI
jgi:hypothetical protein